MGFASFVLMGWVLSILLIYALLIVCLLGLAGFALWPLQLALFVLLCAAALPGSLPRSVAPSWGVGMQLGPHCKAVGL